MLELLNVNSSSGNPIYKQLHEQVVRLIVGGQLQEEDVLPSVRQIANYLAVNPMTVSRAIQQLVDQGWLERRRGQATRVARRTEVMTSGVSLLEPQLNALLSQAKQLGVSQVQLLKMINQHWQD